MNARVHAAAGSVAALVGDVAAVPPPSQDLRGVLVQLASTILMAVLGTLTSILLAELNAWRKRHLARRGLSAPPAAQSEVQIPGPPGLPADLQREETDHAG